MKRPLAVILAGGEGKRMKSMTPKVLHKIAGRPIIEHVVRHVAAAGFENIAIVVPWSHDDIKAALADLDIKARIYFVVQPEPKGTADALSKALEQMDDYTPIMVTNGDQPLLSPDTFKELWEAYDEQDDGLVMLSAHLADPFGYGRIIRDEEYRPLRIVEQSDLDEEMEFIDEGYVGVLMADRTLLEAFLKEVKPDNNQGELYITDILEFTVNKGFPAQVLDIADELEVLQVNTRADLARVEDVLNYIIVYELMEQGVTVHSPQTVFIDQDVKVGQDTEIYPFVRLEAGTVVGKGCVIGQGTIIKGSTIGDNVQIGPYNFIEDSKVKNDVLIGPFNHFRPGTFIDPKAHIGNYVEIKKSVIGEESKVNHQSYIGDAIIGRRVNVGAGTITCNYDGFEKHQTFVEDEAFIGSDTQLVAPVKVGKGAYIGAGTTVTKPVPPGALALSRTPQTHILGYVERKKAKRKSREGK